MVIKALAALVLVLLPVDSFQTWSTIPIPLPEPAVETVPPLGSVEYEVMQYGLSLDDAIELGRVTAYNPVPRQTQGDPLVSSCGPNLENQIALSRDLFFDEAGRKYLCGQPVLLVVVDPVSGEVHDVRETVVFDTMHPRFERAADVLKPTTDESVAFAWGVKVGYLFLLVDEAI